MRRLKIMQDSIDTKKAAEAWMKLQMPKTRELWEAKVNKEARSLLKKLDDLTALIKDERLEGCEQYTDVLQRRLDICIALGDEKRCLQVEKMLGRDHLAKTGDEAGKR
jgi:hypothetical protein